ncbi:MAG: glycosyltransferase family 39 protein [Pseudoxanthomonas sp.]
MTGNHGQAPADRRWDWPAFAFAAVALIAAAFAFAGLGASNFWTDELFTLHVVGHAGGLGEVWRRALTDTHPPLYYFLLYGWGRLGGYSEAWLRLPSAVFAVAALGLAWHALRRRFRPTAANFAAAVAAVSTFWFEQSQNARGYALAMLAAAAMLWLALALEAAWRRRKVAWGWLALLLLAGFAGSFVHAYMLLCAGMVIGALLLALGDWRARAALAVGGLLILAANAGYSWLLLHSTTQDLHGLWFDTGWKFFRSQTGIARHDLAAAGAAVAVNLLVLAAIVLRVRGGRGALSARAGEDGNRAALLAAFVLAGMFASGVAVSYLIAPSYSARNMLTASPFAWTLLAWLYQAAGPRLRTRASRWMALGLCVLVGAHLNLLHGRFIERNEAWRASARFIAAMPGCAGQEVAVMQPFKFGPATPAYRRLAEHDFYGHYAAPATPIRAWLPSELSARQPVPALQAQLAARAGNAARPGQCTLLLWGVHDLDGDTAVLMARELARQPGVAPARVVVQAFVRGKRSSFSWRPLPEGFVFYALPAAAAGAPPRDPGPLVAMPAGVLGDRYVVDYLGSDPNPLDAAAPIDRFVIQRWSYKVGATGQETAADPRVHCRLVPAGAQGHARASKMLPACFDLPPG